MEAVLKKVAEIEASAEAIVAAAEKKKREADDEFHSRRYAFEQEMSAYTEGEIRRIREEGEASLHALVKEEERKRQLEIDRLIQDVERNHTKYAEEVLERVLKI